ncbi:MAG: ArsR family transcriptional regulator [Desulfobulbaceae bacterium]|nr:MAG: ArsR family transcriptional regulator [Desulfobulbaceae bacterium]
MFREVRMASYKSITAAEAHQLVADGNGLLVCAYDSDEKFSKFQLEGAIPLSDYQKRVSRLDKSQTIIFY